MRSCNTSHYHKSLLNDKWKITYGILREIVFEFRVIFAKKSTIDFLKFTYACLIIFMLSHIFSTNGSVMGQSTRLSHGWYAFMTSYEVVVEEALELLFRP